MSNRWNDGDSDDESAPPVPVPVPRRIRIPVKLGTYAVAGVVLNGCHSVRSRRRALVYVVHAPNVQLVSNTGDINPNQLMALKLSWRRIGSIDTINTINNVEEKIRGLLKEHDIGVIASESFGCLEPDNVLQRIRGFAGDSEQIIHLGLEERLLNADLLELKRPVRFFWSIQDFVMGVRGALLGHKWLVDHGILHRGVSEDNIALARRPWERQRGYITNFD
ncbi:hypothetical protein BJ138DRAFT_1129432, partial [Hygrophoropsis aurantiaca]